MNRLAFHLLGSFEVKLGDSMPPVAFAYEKAKALLAFLAVENKTAHRREKLASLFWPDHDEAHARRSLRTALAHINKVLAPAGEEIFVADSKTLRIRPDAPLDLDVAELLSAPIAYSSPTEVQRAERALAGYRGPFLHEMAIRDCEELEGWIREWREQLRKKASDVANTLSRFYDEVGGDEQAIRFARLGTELEPGNEAFHCRLMQLFARKGDVHALRAEYESCVRILAREFDCPPDPATTALYEALVGSTGDSAASRSDPAVPFEGLTATDSTPTVSLPPKVSQPRIGDVVRRNALFEVLHRARQRPVTWIAAPAGSGKTTLAASYIAQHGLSCFWYQLDEGDDDLATFFYYLRLATLRLANGRTQPFPFLTPEYFIKGVPTFARRFFEQLIAQPDRPAVLVFDNYQELPDQSALHAILADNLAQLPEGMGAMVLSRKVPPAAWARARASNAVFALDWSDLRLTEDEAVAIARLRHDRARPDPQEIRRITNLTQGWAAGLVLILDRTGRSGAAPGIRTLEQAEQATFDFFAREIWSGYEKDAQVALLKAAWLPAIRLDSGTALTGYRELEALLSGLADSNSFTYRYADPDTSFQFHPLFRNFLQSTARSTLSPDELRGVLTAAAALLMEERQLDDAAHLLIEAGEWEGLMKLIAGQGRLLLSQGRHRTLAGWVNALPVEIRDDDPWMLFFLGAARFPYDLEEGKRNYQAAFAAFEARQDLAGQILAWSGIVEAVVYAWSDSAPLGRLIAVAEEKFVRHYDALEEGELKTRFTFGMFLSLMYYRPDHPAMNAWTDRVEARIQALPDPSLRILLGMHLLQFHVLFLGEFTQASVVHEMIRPESVGALSPAAQIVWHAIHAVYLYHTSNAHDEARSAFHAAMTTAQESGIRLWDFVVTAIGAYTSINRQDFESGVRYLDQAGKLTSTRRPLELAHQQIVTAWLHLCLGNGDKAFEAARRVVFLTERHGGHFERSTGLIVLSLALRECGSYNEARIEGLRGARVAEEMRSPWVTYFAHLSLAAIAHDLGDLAECDARLRFAFSLGRLRSYVSLHFLTPRMMAVLCSRALDADIETDYARQLIRAHRLRPIATMRRIDTWPWPVCIHTFGEFSILRDGERVDLRAVGQQDAVKMLMVLIALGGKDVPDSSLAELLRSEGEGERSRESFFSVMKRLQHLLGETLQHRESRWSLGDGVWVDAQALEKLLDEAGSRSDTERTSELVFRLYRGPFLASEESFPWTQQTRERLRGKFVRYVTNRGESLVDAADYSAATRLLRRALEVEPLCEELHVALMICYSRQGRHAEALIHYDRYCTALKTELGVHPSWRAEAIAGEIRIAR